MKNELNNYICLSNSDYIWKCEGKNIILKKSYSKSKRFVVRSIFLIVFFYFGFFAAMISSKYGIFILMEYMHVISLILCVISFPLSGVYLEKIDVLRINTESKLIKHTSIIWRKVFQYDSSADFIRNKSFIGGRFQAPIEDLSIKSLDGRMHKVAKIVMPDKNGFQPIINAVQNLE